MCDCFFDNAKEIFAKRLPNTRLFLYESIGSTNTEAKRYAEENPSFENAVFIARSQSAGRGRLGRSFLSGEGGLYLSYLFRPELSCERTLLITVYSAVSLCEVIEEMTGAAPKIKWVNDVFLEGRKIAGILTEGAVAPGAESLRYAVVGIGVNVGKVDFPEELTDIASDIESATGVRPDIGELAVRLAEKLCRFDPSCREEYMRRYRERSLVIERRVKVIAAGGEYYATVRSIDDDGALHVIRDDGKFVRLISGEISIKL